MDDVTGVGDYEVQAGWHVLNEPASTPELWSAMKNEGGLRLDQQAAGAHLVVALWLG
jgi:hypothetical protein